MGTSPATHHSLSRVVGTSRKISTNKIRMLSRQAISRATQARNCLVVSTRGLSLSTPNAERDLVNFPARVRPIDKPPVRLGIFPEEWFTAMYPKTGVTGPYMALFGVATFLASKEFFVMEHDFMLELASLPFWLSLLRRLALTGLLLSINSLMLKKLLLRVLDKMKSTFVKMPLLLKRRLRPKLQLGRTSLPQRKKLLDFNSKQYTEQDFNPLTHRSRKGSTINWRLLML